MIFNFVKYKRRLKRHTVLITGYEEQKRLTIHKNKIVVAIADGFSVSKLKALAHDFIFNKQTFSYRDIRVKTMELNFKIDPTDKKDIAEARMLLDKLDGQPEPEAEEVEEVATKTTRRKRPAKPAAKPAKKPARGRRRMQEEEPEEEEEEEEYEEDADEEENASAEMVREALQEFKKQFEKEDFETLLGDYELKSMGVRAIDKLSQDEKNDIVDYVNKQLDEDEEA